VLARYQRLEGFLPLGGCFGEGGYDRDGPVVAILPLRWHRDRYPLVFRCNTDVQETMDEAAIAKGKKVWDERWRGAGL